MAYLEIIAEQLGIAVWLLAIILIWTLIWKLLALWKSARKGHVAWFIVIAVVNLVGILEILYIFVFSEMKCKSSAKPIVRKSVRKKRR